MEQEVKEMVEVSEKQGIKELKELVGFVVALAQAVAGSLEDGKVGVMDLFKFFGVLRKAGPAFKNLQGLRAEIADLSEAEKAELQAYIEKEFDLGNDVVEGYIEQAIVAAIGILDLLPVFQEQPKA